MLGGGKAMMNAYYATAEKLGVQVRYETEVCGLVVRDGEFQAAVVERDGQRQEIPARAVVVASGGFEANLPWLKKYWGEAADNFIVRGTPYNQGRMLAELLELGVMPVGDEREFHAVAVDARAPKFDGGIITRLDSAPFGIVVNQHGQRFYDEGEDFWPKRYAIWGGLIARQPDQIAYSILDAKAIGKFIPSLYPPIEASSLAELAEAMGLEPTPVAETVERYNRATRPGSVDHSILDGRHHRRARSAQEQLGAADRHPALLGLSAPTRHHLHLPGRGGQRAGASDHAGWTTGAEHLRRGRDHGRQHSGPGLPGRLRTDDRDRLRADCGEAGGVSCRRLISSKRPNGR